MSAAKIGNIVQRLRRIQVIRAAASFTCVAGMLIPAAAGFDRTQHRGCGIPAALQRDDAPRSLQLAMAAPPPGDASDCESAKIDDLIKRLGSKKFAERDAAFRRLKEIGKPALPALRKAAKSSADPQIRETAKNLVGLDLEQMFQDGIEQETVAKDYKKAARTFQEIVRLTHADGATNRVKQGGSPELDRALLFLHLARSLWGAEQF